MNAPSKDQVIEAYNRAPDAVRETFNAESTTRVVINLQHQYGLHIDQAGVLGKELGYMLLGLVNPSEFVSHLKAAGIPGGAVSAIVGEINQKVFIPLRDKMRHAGQSAHVEPAPPSRPAPPPPSYGERPSTPPPQPPVPPMEPFRSPQQVAAPAPPPQRGEPVAPQRPPAPPPQSSRPLGPSEAPEPPIPMPAPPREAAGATPLPPRTVLPGAAQAAGGNGAIIHNPWPASPTGRAEPAPPPNLPTGVSPEKGTYTEPEPGFNAIPPLTKPPAPPPPRAADPYREPIE